VRAVYAAAERLAERARSGEGPAFLLCNTYRYRGHHVGDVDRSYYRPKEEEQSWSQERDPLDLLAEWLLAQGLATRDALDKVRAEIKAEIEAGADFALQAPYPDESEVDQHVYA
ncbi:MAG TPA: thiamine pyrophosphate-dependent enzyme, partial [Xanthomonadales bacterium]|nr:thiamine pyrophosphate-dependent enzyme [Xanthomonadales bacterium]